MHLENTDDSKVRKTGHEMDCNVKWKCHSKPL